MLDEEWKDVPQSSYNVLDPYVYEVVQVTNNNAKKTHASGHVLKKQTKHEYNNFYSLLKISF